MDEPKPEQIDILELQRVSMKAPVIKPERQTAVARTEAAISGEFAGRPGRISQARAFIKRAKKSDARRKVEKASRKRNR